MKPIVIIPARGGSKRIPRKNISEINGQSALNILVLKLQGMDLFEKIKQDFERGKTQTDIQTESDLKEIELALSLPQELIKERFKNPSVVRSAIGNRKIFPTDNQERINKVLNEIFK